MAQLTKTSDHIMIRDYFRGGLELSRQSKQFPVDLEDIWPLVYSRKDAATRELQKNFIEGIDYQLLHQKVEAENRKNNAIKIVYLLSVPCLEYFIARKVRAVFEIYRLVFHKVNEQYAVPRSFAEALQLAADQQRKIEQQELQIHLNNIKIAEDKPKVEFVDDYIDMPEQSVDITLTELAQMICVKGYDIGVRRLCEWMRQHRYLYKSDNANIPTQYSLNLKLMTVYKFNRGIGNDGKIKICKQTKVTPKGQVYFCEKFRKFRENGELKLPKQKKTKYDKFEEDARENPEFKVIWEKIKQEATINK